MGEPRANRIMRFQRKHMRLVLQTPDGSTEHNPAEIVFKLSAVSGGMVWRSASGRAD
jgi:hypothetical protein